MQQLEAQTGAHELLQGAGQIIGRATGIGIGIGSGGGGGRSGLQHDGRHEAAQLWGVHIGPHIGGGGGNDIIGGNVPSQHPGKQAGAQF